MQVFEKLDLVLGINNPPQLYSSGNSRNLIFLTNYQSNRLYTGLNRRIEGVICVAAIMSASLLF